MELGVGAITGSRIQKRKNAGGNDGLGESGWDRAVEIRTKACRG